MTMQQTQAPGSFNPNVYLTMVGNHQYLEVKYRVLWFRDTHPSGIIETELVEHKVSAQHPELSYAVFKASVQDGQGGAATGYGTEAQGDFRDYLEKAETRAIGRALAALGYGTQFCGDLETGGRLVDNPARSHATHGTQPSSGSNGYYPNGQDTGELATPKQVSFARGLIKQAELHPDAVTAILAQDFQANDLAELTKREISQLIDGLKSGRFNQAQPTAAAAASSGSPDDPFGDDLPF